MPLSTQVLDEFVETEGTYLADMRLVRVRVRVRVTGRGRRGETIREGE